jgi:hypothetical protein
MAISFLAKHLVLGIKGKIKKSKIKKVDRHASPI